jgi:hypothetical protein
MMGDPLGGVLFAPIHLCTFCFTVVAHPTCVFPSLAYDTCIIDFASNVLPIILGLHEKFGALGLLV